MLSMRTAHRIPHPVVLHRRHCGPGVRKDVIPMRGCRVIAARRCIDAGLGGCGTAASCCSVSRFGFWNRRRTESPSSIGSAFSGPDPVWIFKPRTLAQGNNMLMQDLPRRTLAFVASVAIAVLSGWASADPPLRVARLGYMTGMVSFSPCRRERLGSGRDQSTADHRRPSVDGCGCAGRNPGRRSRRFA